MCCLVLMGKQDRMAALLNEQGVRLQGEIGSGILWSKDDAYAWVMGRPERPGCVRGVGFGITPLGRSATNLSQFTSTPSSSSRTTQRMLELETSHEELREQLAQSREELAKHRVELAQSEARHREELAQSKARHQAQMAEVMTSMRDMFNQLSPLMRDSNPSQVANKCYLAKHYFLQCIFM